MEEEIDLRIYLETLLKWWREIIIIVVLAVLAASLFSFLSPQVYQASVLLAYTASRSEIEFEPRYLSVDEGNLPANIFSYRILGLASQVKNPEIAQFILDTYPELFASADPAAPPITPAQLVTRIDGEYIEKTDTIRITATAVHPDDAAIIANAWGRQFIEIVNEVNSEANVSLVVVSQQVVDTKNEYDRKETMFIEFMTHDNVIDELKRQVNEKTKIVQSYLETNIANQVFFVQRNQQTKQAILGKWLEAEQTNRLAALDYNQRLRQDLFDAFTEAEANSQLTIFDQQISAKLTNLTQAYDRKNRYQGFLVDATALLNLLEKSSEASAASNNLAIQLLKTEVFATSETLPANLQLQLPPVGPRNDLAQQQADIAALISVLEEQVGLLDTEIQHVSEALLAGEDYAFLAELTPENFILNGEIDQIDEIDGAPTVTNLPLYLNQSGSDTNTLSAQILKRYLDLYQVGILGQTANQVDEQTPLYQQIGQAYQATLIGEVPWLNSARISSDIGPLSNVNSSDQADSALNQQIVVLETEIRLLQAEISRLENQLQVLTYDRDLAWETYQTLANKQAELTIASQIRDTQLRLAVPATLPQKSANIGLLRIGLIAGALGLMLAVFGVFVLDYMAVEPFFRRKNTLNDAHQNKASI